MGLQTMTMSSSTNSIASQPRTRPISSRIGGSRQACRPSSLLVPAPHAYPHVLESAQDHGIGRDREQDERAQDGVQGELADAQPGEEADLERLDEERPEQCPEHRPGTTEDVDATHDGGGDDLQLQT